MRHHTKSKVGQRRSQQALKPLPILVCSSCGGPVLAHRTCSQCGFYHKSPKIKKANRNQKSK